MATTLGYLNALYTCKHLLSQYIQAYTVLQCPSTNLRVYALHPNPTSYDDLNVPTALQIWFEFVACILFIILSIIFFNDWRRSGCAIYCRWPQDDTLSSSKIIAAGFLPFSHSYWHQSATLLACNSQEALFEHRACALMVAFRRCFRLSSVQRAGDGYGWGGVPFTPPYPGGASGFTEIVIMVSYNYIKT